MARLPDVYQIYDQFGWGVYVYSDAYTTGHFEDATWLLEDEATKFLNYINDISANKPRYIMKKVDKEIVRVIGNSYMNGSSNLGDDEDIFPIRTLKPIIDCLKDEKDNLIKLSEAFKPVMKGMNNMKENEVAVRFYEGFISKENVTLKEGDKSVKMVRVKMPNDDPDDSQVRRSFIVRESSVGTDTKNPHMKYVYLNKDSEYRVVRKNFDPETKKSEILEDIKMTGQAISDIFKADRDREYAEYKASKGVDNLEIDAPEEVIEIEDGMEI